MNSNTTSIAIKARVRPALRLIETKQLSRAEWLASRKKGIGSSDAAAAIGLSPYKSQLALWLEKTGRDQALANDGDENGDTPMAWGTILEPIVAAQYARRTGRRVRRVNAVLQHPDPELSWMLANIDREIVGDAEVQVLECKTAGLHSAKHWRDQVPEYVQLQVQHQLAVTGKQCADVAVLVAGQKLDIFRIERDDMLIARLIRLERQFWRYVETDVPPPADGSESSAAALRALFPEDSGETLDFTHDVVLSAKFSDLQQVKLQQEHLKGLEGELKNTIQQAMGAATTAVFETGRISWKKAKDSPCLDTARLLRERPELLAQYQHTKSGSRRFLIL